MFGIIGIVGALLVGIVVDGVIGVLMRKSRKGSARLRTDLTQGEGHHAFNGNLLEWLGLDADTATSRTARVPDASRTDPTGHGTGTDGAGWFELADQAAGDALDHISGYDARDDALVVVYDPALHPHPRLSLQTPENTGDAIVLLDGIALARVQGGAGLRLQDVLLTAAQAA